MTMQGQERGKALADAVGPGVCCVWHGSTAVSVCFIVCVLCVFITVGPITKLFVGGGGGEWTTCAMIDDEPRPVWMSPLITH